MRKLLTASILVAVSVAIVFYLSPSNSSGQTVDKAAESAPAQPKLPPNIEITPDGGVNFYTTFKGQRIRSLAISPQGSLIAGGVSKGANAPFTDDPPTIAPSEYDEAGAGGGRNWIHDFYFGRYVPGEGQPRLHTRGLIMWGRGDSPDIQLGRTGPDNTECPHTPRHNPPGTTNPDCPHTMYGPPTDTSPGTSLGKIVFVNWGEGEFQGDLAGITARNDTIATKTKNPGSLHFHTAGPTTFTDPAKAARAWRDGPERLVIKSNGYVGIGDEPSATERLHVHGNVLAEGNITAARDVVARGSKKFEIDHPTQPDKRLVHASIEGPESAVYYRGQAQLINGRAVIYLPEYFESLARPEGRTVIMTNMDGFDRLAVERQSGMPVRDGKFVVISENARSSQAFCWEVKAVRADIAPLQVER